MSKLIGKPSYFGWHGVADLGDTMARQNFVGANSYLFGMSFSSSMARQLVCYAVKPGFTRLLGVNKNFGFFPGTNGTDGGKAIQISPDLRFMAVGGNWNTNNYEIYRLSDFSFVSRNPLQTEYTSSNVDTCAFSANSAYFATGVNNTKCYVYNVSDSTAGSAWTNVTNKTFTGASVRSVTFSPNGTWFVAGGGKDTSTNQYIKIYLQSDWSEVSAPTQPAGTVFDIAFSADSALCAVAHTTTPFLTVYDTSSTPWTKLADVSSLPAGNGSCVSWLGSSYLCIGHAGSPYKTIYKVSDWSKLTSPFNSAPAALGTARYSPDGTMLAVSANPNLYIYDISGESYTQRSPADTPPYISNFAWFQDGKTNL